MVWSDKKKTRLDGRLVVITGANTGIGKETAMELSRRGARILILCRNVDKAKDAKTEITRETGGTVDVMKLDLSSLKSVRQCADEILLKEEKIDILINNAGVMYCPHWKTEDGFDMQFGTNHLGHFLLTELLRPLVKKAVEPDFRPRIVIVSSLGHTLGPINWDDINWEKSYSMTNAYYQSKLANVLHAKELARRVEADNISVYVLHPGVVNTELGRHMYEKWYGACMKPIVTRLSKTPWQGAQTTLYCCLEEKIANDSGKYYSDCKEKQAHSRARDVSAQKRMWEISEKMVGLQDEGGRKTFIP